MDNDILKTMNTWADRRIQELRKWRLHHEACIKEIDEQIESLKGTEGDYEEFIKQIKSIKS